MIVTPFTEVSPPANGYGYHFWPMRGEKRRFVMRGVYGQSIYVDPELKLLLVHTAVASTASIGNQPMGAELGALWGGLVRRSRILDVNSRKF